MATDRIGPVGAAAGTRPILSTVLIAAGVAALAAFGADRAGGASALKLLSGLIAAFVCVTLAPTAVGASAPQRLPMRLVHAGLAAFAFIGASYAASRWGGQEVFETLALDAGLAIGAVAAALLTVGAGLWRNELRLSVAGLAAVMLGAAGGLAALDAFSASVSGISAERLSGAASLDSLAIGAACGAAAIIAVGAVARFARDFAAGATPVDAASVAADEAMAFALLCAVVFGAIAALSGAADAAAHPLRSTLLVAAIVGGSALCSGLIGAGGCGLRRLDEGVAVIENRRREVWLRALRPLRKALPVSTALAFVAVGAIVGVVACFESAAARNLALWGLAAAVAGGAAISFFSLRIAMFAALTLGLLLAPLAALFGVAALPPGAVLVGFGLASVTVAQLAVVWRAQCHPQRKPSMAAELALAQGAPAHLAALAIGASALLAVAISGAWPHAYAACAVFGATGLAALAISPAVMTVLGSITSRW